MGWRVKRPKPRGACDLAAGTIGQAIIHLKRTTSTNDVAADLARRGAAEGTLVIADEQTAGRGRRGHAWLAPPRRGLLCSLILRPMLPAARLPRLTMLAALACARAIQGLGLPATIKWPNDILINGRKVGGILAEADFAGDRLNHVVVGIGINVNVEQADLTAISPQATSLAIEAGRRLSRWHLLRLLLAEFAVRYESMLQDEGQAVYKEWAQCLDTLGRDVTVTGHFGALCGRAESVDADGGLFIRRNSGELVRVTFEDVG